MTTSLECPICRENYRRDINPPMSIVPCGHNICKACLESIQRGTYAHARKCPYCQTKIQSQMMNWALMDHIEEEPASSGRLPQDLGQAPQPSANPSQACAQGAPFFNMTMTAQAVSASRQYKEFIRDSTDAVFGVLDNSGSMNNTDGKIFEKASDGRIKRKVKGAVTRWDEAVHKCKQVAKYNLDRGVPATYYLLNPKKSGSWIPGQDCVEIDPKKENDWQSVLTKLQPLLNPGNVGGRTPLDVITNHLLEKLRGIQQSDLRICYILFTDGEPNHKQLFETSVRNLANAVRVDGLHGLFFTINLCTDEDNVVEYYNDLDQKLGSELSGMDVLDDFEAEMREVEKAGNSFITYCEELHVCRMAGCNSVVADLLDEKRIGAFHMAKMIREVLRLDITEHACANCGERNLLNAQTCHTCGEISEGYNPSYSDAVWIDDTESFLQTVRCKNPQVWDIRKRRFQPLVDVQVLRKEIACFKKGGSGDGILSSTFSFCKWAVFILFLAILLSAVLNAANSEEI